MSARLTAVLDFVGSKFQAGIARANASLANFKQNAKGFNSTLAFLKGGIIGSAVLMALRAASQLVDKIRESGRFDLMSETQVRGFEKAREAAGGILDSLKAAAAIAISKVASVFQDENMQSDAERNKAAEDTEDQRKLMTEIRAIKAARTEANDDDIAVLELEKSHYERLAYAQDKTNKERLEAVKKVLEIEDKIAKLSHITVKKTEVDKKLKQAVIDPSARRNYFADLRQQDRDDRKFNKIFQSAKDKLDPQSDKFGKKLTSREELALKAKGESVTLESIAKNTDRTAKSIEKALALGN